MCTRSSNSKTLFSPHAGAVYAHLADIHQSVNDDKRCPERRSWHASRLLVDFSPEEREESVCCEEEQGGHVHEDRGRGRPANALELVSTGEYDTAEDTNERVQQVENFLRRPAIFRHTELDADQLHASDCQVCMSHE